MMEEGLVDEVKSLYDRGLLVGKTASQAIGYKEIVEYLEGLCTLDEAVEKLKMATRRYAKRQLTWFRHEKGASVIYADIPDGDLKSGEELVAEAIELCRAILTE